MRVVSFFSLKLFVDYIKGFLKRLFKIILLHIDELLMTFQSLITEFLRKKCSPSLISSYLVNITLTLLMNTSLEHLLEICISLTERFTACSMYDGGWQ